MEGRWRGARGAALPSAVCRASAWPSWGRRYTGAIGGLGAFVNVSREAATASSKAGKMYLPKNGHMPTVRSVVASHSSTRAYHLSRRASHTAPARIATQGSTMTRVKGSRITAPQSTGVVFGMTVVTVWHGPD